MTALWTSCGGRLGAAATRAVRVGISRNRHSPGEAQFAQIKVLRKKALSSPLRRISWRETESFWGPFVWRPRLALFLRSCAFPFFSVFFFLSSLFLITRLFYKCSILCHIFWFIFYRFSAYEAVYPSFLLAIFQLNVLCRFCCCCFLFCLDYIASKWLQVHFIHAVDNDDMVLKWIYIYKILSTLPSPSVSPILIQSLFILFSLSLNDFFFVLLFFRSLLLTIWF